MPVDAVGSALANAGANTEAGSLEQSDFIELFLTELNYQDPLEPIDNREFLAQIAQFSALEQSRSIGEGIENLVLMNSGSQVLGILGRSVTIETESGLVVGTVSSANYNSDGPLLNVVTSEGGPVFTDVRLSRVRRVQ